MGTLTARLRWLAHRLLWLALVPVVVFLALDYKKNGSKPSSEVDVVRIPSLDLPWIMFDGFLGKNGACYMDLVSCTFGDIQCIQSMERVHEGWRENERKLSSSYLHSAFLLNPKKMSRIGITYTNLAEHLTLKFAVKSTTDNSIVNPLDITTLCSPFLNELSTTVMYLSSTVSTDNGVVFDGNSKSRLESNWDNNAAQWNKDKKLPSKNSVKYITVGLGQVAIMQQSLSIFCQGDCNADVSRLVDYMNLTTIDVTQLSKYSHSYYEVRIQPASFSITTVSQKDGSSIFDLLGTIFGWVGILTGACVYTITDDVLSWTRSFVKKTASAVKDLENSTGFKLHTQEDVVNDDESTAVYEEMKANKTHSFKQALRDDAVDVEKIRYNLDHT